MGLVLPHGGGLAVYEAVGPVRYTPAAEWVARGEGGRVLVKRLRAPRTLSNDQVELLVRAAEQFLGKPYDAAFGWSDDRLYCSEVVWKVFSRTLGVELGALSVRADATSPRVGPNAGLPRSLWPISGAMSFKSERMEGYRSSRSVGSDRREARLSDRRKRGVTRRHAAPISHSPVASAGHATLPYTLPPWAWCREVPAAHSEFLA